MSGVVIASHCSEQTFDSIVRWGDTDARLARMRSVNILCVNCGAELTGDGRCTARCVVPVRNPLPVETDWRTGDRVVRSGNSGLRRLGTVSFVRSGFVCVRWDHGGDSLEWGAELILDGGLRA
jgi:hypothetical protein